MSCLFDSLSHYLPAYTSVELRQIICNHLAGDNYVAHARATEQVRWNFNTSLQEYVRKMRQTSTWGGAIEIQTFCELFMCSVRCSTPPRSSVATKDITFVPLHGIWTHVCTINWDGGHYTTTAKTTAL
jgi:hypothetical protein